MGMRVEKVKRELRTFWAELKLSWSKRDSIKDAHHFYTDIFVEAFRNMPYLLGHIAAVYVAVVAFLALGNWVVSL